ncbi:MAG TPA: hypothetical protein VMB25_11365 [Bryobacteraceae bacterium]|nr:hypothetical protein [Bryobacteraceae bacterium]
MIRWTCIVLLCATLAGCRARQSASLHIDPSLEALVPADTVLVAGANLDAIRNTPVYQMLLARVPLPQLEQFTRRTGLDPRKDLSEFLVSSDGKNAVVMARGKFQTGALEARLESKGMARFTYKKYRLFGNEQAAVVFLNDSTVLAGPAPELRVAVDRSSGLGLPASLRDLLRTLPADDQVYAALVGGLEKLNLPIPKGSDLGNLTQILQSVDSATLGINLSHGIDALAVVNSKTERDAKFVHDMVKGLVGFGRLRTPDNQPDLLKVYDGIQVTQQQSQARITADIPADLVDKALNLWLKR